MTAPRKQDFVLNIKTRDEARKVLRALGRTGFAEARRAGRGFEEANRKLMKLERTGKRVTNSLRGGFTKLSSLLQGRVVASLALVVATLVSFGSARAAVTTASEFQLALAEVNTILPETAKGVVDLRTAVLDLATAQGENEKIVARGLYQTISAGISDAGDALVVLEQASRLAIAGLSSTDQTVDLLTTTLNAYRLEVDEAGRLSDVFFETVRLGKTTISELASSIGPVLPLASALGITIEEVNAGLATLTTQGFSTGDAATALRALFKALIKESEDLDTVFQRVGKTYDLNTIQSQGLVETLRQLAEGLRDPSEALEVLGARIEASNALFGLTGQNFETFSSTADSLANSLGSTARAYEEIAGTPAKRVEIATNAIRIAFIDLGDSILNSLSEAFGGLDEIQKLQNDLRGVAQVLGPIIGDLLKAVVELGKGLVSFPDDARLFTSEVDLLVKRFELFGKTIAIPFQLIGRIIADLVGTIANLVDSIPGVDLGIGKVDEERLRGLDARIKVVRRDILRAVRVSTGEDAPGSANFLQSVEAARAALRELRPELDQLEAERASVAVGFVARMEKLSQESEDAIKSLRDGFVASVEAVAAAEDAVVAAQDRAARNAERRAAQAAAAAAAARSGIGFGASAEGLSGVPGFSGGIDLPQQVLDIEKAVNAELVERARLRELERIANERVVLDAEQALQFRELLASIDSQSAVTSAERVAVERELLEIFESRVRAQAEGLGLGEQELSVLEASLARLREVREADFLAGSGSSSGGGFDEQRLGLLRQVQTPDAQLEVIRSTADARRADIALQQQQNRLTDEQARKLTSLVGVIQAQQEAQAGMTQTQLRAQQAVQSFTNSVAFGLEDALVSVITTSKSAKDAFSGLVKALIVDLIRLGIRLAVTNILLAIFDGLTLNLPAIGAASTAASTVASAQAFAQANAGVGSSLQNAGGPVGPQTGPLEFADGGIPPGQLIGVGQGIVRSPTTALIGEGQSDEAIVPLKNGAIPVQNLGGGGGGNTLVLQAIDTRSGVEFLLANAETINSILNGSMSNDQATRTNVRRVTGTRGFS